MNMAGMNPAMMGSYYAITGIIYLFFLICSCVMYSKAGKPWWAAIIPIYNIIVLLQIIGKPWPWIFLLLIPVVNVIILIIMLHGLSKSFGHGGGFTVGLIFLSIIFFPILAFSKNKYVGAGK